MTFLLFIAGCLLLFFGGHFLVESSSQIARRFHVSELIIGLTLVSIGTSLPEVVVNIIARLQAESDVVIGNILGSNISNTLLILGATGVLSPLIIPTCRLARELRFYCFCIASYGFELLRFLFRRSCEYHLCKRYKCWTMY